MDRRRRLRRQRRHRLVRRSARRGLPSVCERPPGGGCRGGALDGLHDIACTLARGMVRRGGGVTGVGLRGSSARYLAVCPLTAAFGCERYRVPTERGLPGSMSSSAISGASLWASDDSAGSRPERERREGAASAATRR